MENEYNYEQIEAFLDGELKGEELTSFEQELDQNMELSSGVEWAKAINQGVNKHQKQSEIRNLLESVHCDLEEEGAFDGIQEYSDREEVVAKGIQKAIRTDYIKGLKNIHEELSSSDKLHVPRKTGKVRLLAVKRYWAAAAFIGVLLMAGLFYLPNGQNDVFADNFEAYEDILSKDVEIVLSERGAALDVEALEQLQVGLKDYQNKDFAKAIPVFEQYLKSSAKNYKGEEVQFYLAVSNLGAGQTNKAIKGFDMLLKSESSKFKVDIEWYLALAHIKNDELSSAKSLLKGLESNDKYSKQAKNILEGLK